MAKKTLTFTSNQTWTVPNDCYRITELFVVGGGGGGGGGYTNGNGGGGGGGGMVSLFRDISVTPGQQISIVVGTGGAGGNVNANGQAGGSSSFGSYSASGGGFGYTNGGSGGSTSSNIFGIITNYPGSSAGGGAGAGATAISKNGAAGYLYNGIHYGGGGGAGINAFNQNTARPLIPGIGGITGGGRGAGEDTAADPTNEGLSYPGIDTYGAGGGGGAASGISTERSGARFRTVPATAGARGGSGVIILSYDPAEFVMTSDKLGVKEGEAVTITVQTTHVLTGTVIPYTLSGDGVTQEDFSPAGLTGSFTVISSDQGNTGVGTIVLTLAGDAFTDGSAETVVVSLDNGLAVTSFMVGDWSQNPLVNVLSKTISVTDYNRIRNKVAMVLGPSTTNPDYGWGQVVRSSPVLEGNKVGATEWNNLRYDIINAWIHLYNTAPSLSSAVQHNLIRGNYLDAPYSQYDAFASVIDANRFGINSSQSVVTTEAYLETIWPGPYGPSWNTRAYAVVTVSWTTAEEARHFFNSGGEIRFTSSRSGGTVSNQNASWTQILAAAGTQAFGGARPAQGISGVDGKNFYRLSSGYQTWYEVSASTPYSANRYRITARNPMVTNNNSGTATSVQFQIEWLDDHAAQGGTTPDLVDGTLTLTVVVQRAIGTLQPPGAGNFEISAPTITINEPPRS